MDLQPCEALKRKRTEEAVPSASVSIGANAEGGKAAQAIIASASVLNACRKALVNGPAASRAALGKYGSFIDPSLMTMLETIGSYEIEVLSSFLIFLP